LHDPPLQDIVGRQTRAPDALGVKEFVYLGIGKSCGQIEKWRSRGPE
jgi:hypothetical protein